jgi:hypothetical protein
LWNSNLANTGGSTEPPYLCPIAGFLSDNSDKKSKIDDLLHGVSEFKTGFRLSRIMQLKPGNPPKGQ